MGSERRPSCRFNDANHLKMSSRIHPLMQDADYRDAIIRPAKINDMLLDRPTTISGPDGRTILPTQRRFGQVDTGCLDEVDIIQGLDQAPLRHAVVKNPVKIALLGRTEPKSSQAAQTCVA